MFNYHDSPRPECDPRVSGERLLAMGVIAKAISDATSRTGDREWRRDARAFLLDEDGALSFWLQVLDVDERRVRGLIARVLWDGNDTGTAAAARAETDEIGPSLLRKLTMRRARLGESGRVGSTNPIP